METQYERTVPTGPVEVELRLAAEPKSAELARTRARVQGEYRGGVFRFRL